MQNLLDKANECILKNRSKLTAIGKKLVDANGENEEVWD